MDWNLSFQCAVSAGDHDKNAYDPAEEDTGIYAGGPLLFIGQCPRGKIEDDFGD